MSIAATLYHDVRRLLRAARRHPGERRDAVPLDLGLAFLEVTAPGAGEDKPELVICRTAVTDLGAVGRPVELVLDVWRQGEVADGHVGHVVARLTRRPRRRLPVEIRWDGAGPARAYAGLERLDCDTRPAGASLSGQCRVVLSLRLDGLDRDTVQVILGGGPVPA